MVLSYPKVTLAGVLVPVAIVVLGSVVFRPWSDPLGADVRDGRVETVVGEPAVRSVDLVRRFAWSLLASASNYYGSMSRGDRLMTIGARRFTVPEQVASAVAGRYPVRAYYLPRSGTLLSLEPA